MSREGGTLPAWSADGKELFYLGSGTLMAVPVETAGGFRHDPPVVVFANDLSVVTQDGSAFDVAPDGKRILVLSKVIEKERDAASVTLVQQWRALLE